MGASCANAMSAVQRTSRHNGAKHRRITRMASIGKDMAAVTNLRVLC
jgi:hypothetical protein